MGAYERESIIGAQTKYKTLARVEEGDIVVNKIWARNGSVAVVPKELEGSYVSGEFPTFIALSNRLNPRWFHWITRTKDFWKQCDEKSRGTSGKNRIRPERFLEIEIPLPSLIEQQRILSRFERLSNQIKSLSEIREIAISDVDRLVASALRTVFDGLRQSWPTTALGEVCKTASGGTPNRARPDFYSGGIPWVKSGELNDGIISNSEESINSSALEESSAKLFPAGTLVVALYGATVGRTGVLGVEAATNQAVCALFPNESLERDYLWWFLKRMRPIFMGDSFGGAQPNISQTTIRLARIPMPPVPVQRAVMAYLANLQSSAESLRKTQMATDVDLRDLQSSVLHLAISGEL
jgi:type I restriction enzyme S subunit